VFIILKYELFNMKLKLSLKQSVGQDKTEQKM